ncbi:hypothetical protein DFS34DRAFT_648269 [Phlyctochytrium arcticum]|nr:hypothetical protein DFS34DRAFT_648269 [Phlyctochytrium arcticum]
MEEISPATTTPGWTSFSKYSTEDRFLTLDHAGRNCLRRGGHLIPITRLSLITNGYIAKLTFEVLVRGDLRTRRIPMIAELSEVGERAHAEFRPIENPGISGGGLYAISRCPIAPARRVIYLQLSPPPSPFDPTVQVPATRPVIGIDFGQRFQTVAVSDNLSSMADGARQRLQQPNVAEATIRQGHRTSAPKQSHA